MGLFKNLFTWWEGASVTTAWFSWRHGRGVGEDQFGNRYFEARKGGRRWVIYSGSNDVSRVPPEWYSWLTGQLEGPPDEVLPPPPAFLRQPTPNLTGTPAAYRPPGALERGGRRAAATGDYQAWTPDGA
ncbi:MAG: NADH:ubiquinone oxidoreductase subunit NDUFA12 [Sphingomonas sp.]